MGLKIILVSALVVILIFGLTGCATTRRDAANLQVQQLQMRVSNLEKELQRKDEKIRYLENDLEGTRRIKVVEMTPASKTNISKPISRGIDTSKPTPKQIQIALKNAGFYKGSIDGKIGRQTKKAIENFQEANGLNVDGVAGTKTWAKLKRYLD